MDEENKLSEEKRKFFDVPAKTAFIMGVLVGVSVISVIGLLLVLTKPEFGLTKGTSNTNKTAATANANTNVANTNTAQPTAPTKVNLAIQDTDHVLGDKNAPVKIFEFSDIQCPYCGQYHPNIEKLVADYGDKIALIFKNFPLSSMHPEAQPAAEAAECVADLAGTEKYYEYLSTLFENQSSLGQDYYLQTAKGLGVNETKFKDCLASDKTLTKIQNDYQEGINAGVNGTPATFINGQLATGAVPYEDLKAFVDSIL